MELTLAHRELARVARACELPLVGGPISALSWDDLKWAQDNGVTGDNEIHQLVRDWAASMGIEIEVIGTIPAEMLSRHGYGYGDYGGYGGYGDGYGGYGDSYGGYGYGYGDYGYGYGGYGYGDGGYGYGGDGGYGYGDGGYGYGYGGGDGYGYGDGAS